MTTALELRGISKRFGSVMALDGADFVVQTGVVHGLLGENGAGKSTLMRVAFGLIRADAGTISVGGRPMAFPSPEAAKKLGIGMVHQHFTSVPAMSVRENLWLAAGRYGAAVDGLERAAGGGAVGRLRSRLWEGLDPEAEAQSLPVGAKQRLEILMALAPGAEILLLDEPTAVLAPPEVKELLELLRQFADGGGAAILITHKLDEVMTAVDNVTVLRQGKVTLDGPIGGQTESSLAAAMVGEAGSLLQDDVTKQVADYVGKPVVSGLGWVVSAGEIVGIAAVEGNGQRELLRGVAGVGPPIPGIEVAGSVAFIPEDRTTEGLIPAFSLAENLVLGLPDDVRWSRGPWLDWSAAERRMADLIPQFGIRATGPRAEARSLSGGNQQKVVLARALESRPALLVAENPTRGLDVHAAAAVRSRLRDAARSGAGVLVFSPDLDELFALADRIVVMHRGALLSVPIGADRETVGALMLGASSER